MVHELIEIEYWESSDGETPVFDFLSGISNSHDQGRILKINDQYQRYTLEQFKRHQNFEPIKGHKDLWELKYRGKGGFNYRMICTTYENKVVGLVMFHGSGSGGKIRKYIEVAKHRAENLNKN